MTLDSLVIEELGEICAIKATNRAALISHINQFVDTFFFDGSQGKAYLEVSLSGEKLGCAGGSVDYPTEVDVPHCSVSCPCGNPKHWLIKYVEV